MVYFPTTATATDPNCGWSHTPQAGNDLSVVYVIVTQGIVSTILPTCSLARIVSNALSRFSQSKTWLM